MTNAWNLGRETSLDALLGGELGTRGDLLAPLEALLRSARDPRAPVLARLRALGAVGRRVDSLFQLRAGALRARADEPRRATRRARLRSLLAEAQGLLTQEVFPALRDRHFWIAEWAALDPREGRVLADIFLGEISPLLTPLTVDATHPFPRFASLALNVAVSTREPRTGARRFVGIEIPPTVPRFLRPAPGGLLVPIESVLGANLPVLLPGLEVLHHHPFRVTRDGRPLRARGLAEARGPRTRAAVRLEVDAATPRALRASLAKGLGLESGDVDSVSGPLDLAAVAALPLALGLDRSPVRTRPKDAERGRRSYEVGRL